MKATAHLLLSRGPLQPPPDGVAVTNETSIASDVRYSGLPGFGLNKILVPIDSSELSVRTLRYAAPLAQQFGASLCLVHVVEKTSLATDLSVPSSGWLRAEAATFGMPALTNLRHREIGAHFPGETLIRSGEPAHAISEAAQELGADLIVISTMGWPQPCHAVFGPLAERVARLSHCPVLTVRENSLCKNDVAEGVHSTTPWQHIVVPIDYSDSSRHAARYAATLAARLSARLTLVSILDPGGANPGQRPMSCNKDAERALTSWAKEEIHGTLQFSTEVGMGFPSDNVLEQECKRLKADLIVLGIRNRHGLGLLGDPSELILRHAPCPVLSVKPTSNLLFRSRVTSFMRYGKDLMYRLSTNAYVFWGALIIAASLVLGELTHVEEVLWRATFALGVATVIIGLLHASLDVRSHCEGSGSRRSRGPKGR